MCASTRACSTIGTPTVSSTVTAIYYACISAALIALSIFDVHTRRVPNKALAFMLPLVLAAPFVTSTKSLPWSLLQSLLGAACGFGVLLAAGLVSKGSAGIGGGDIKLAGLIGFVFGPYGIMGILLTAVFLAVPVGLLCKLHGKGKVPLHLAFVPFMTAGSLLAAAIKLFL